MKKPIIPKVQIKDNIKKELKVLEFNRKQKPVIFANYKADKIDIQAITSS